MNDEARTPSSISRRDLLKVASAAGAAALAPTGLGATPTPAVVLPTFSRAPAGPLMNLTAAETDILSAMIDRLIPSDDLGPGALASGVLRFIDRVLSETESGSVDAYRAGLAALDGYSKSSRGVTFAELPESDRDALLVEVQSGSSSATAAGFVGSPTSFFNMVKDHTWQGMFGDPQYGGNIDFAGWDLLGYPGVRLRVTDAEQREMESERLEPARRSAYDFGQFQGGGSR